MFWALALRLSISWISKCTTTCQRILSTYLVLLAMALRPSSLFTAQVCIIVAYIIFNHCTYALHSDLKKGEKMPKSGPLLTFAFHLAFMYTVLEYYKVWILPIPHTNHSSHGDWSIILYIVYTYFQSVFVTKYYLYYYYYN